MSPQLAEIMQQAESLSSAKQLQLIAHLAQCLSDMLTAADSSSSDDAELGEIQASQGH